MKLRQGEYAQLITDAAYAITKRQTVQLKLTESKVWIVGDVPELAGIAVIKV